MSKKEFGKLILEKEKIGIALLEKKESGAKDLDYDFCIKSIVADIKKMWIIYLGMPD